LGGTRNIIRPSTQTGAKLVRPFVRGFKNDAATVPAHDDFISRSETAVSRKTYGLTAAVAEQFGP